MNVEDRRADAAGLTLVTSLLVIALLGIALGAVLLVPVHHDIGWPLHVARKVIGGERLYGTIVEINPPLIFWYAHLAEVAGSALGIGGIAFYHVLSALIVAAGIGAAGWLLSDVLEGGRPWARAFLITVFAFLAGPFAGYQFGQREHLLFATLLPYLLGAVATIRGRTLPAAPLFGSGLLTAFGLAMKPFFLPIWVGTEFMVWRRRGRPALARPQAFGVLAGFIAYGVAALLFARDYLRVARWGMDAYGAFHPARFVPDILLSVPNAFTLATLLVVALAPRMRGLDPFRRIALFALAVLVLAVYVQRKGWDYHWYPVLALATLLLATTAIAILDTGRVRALLRHRPRAPRTAFVAAALVLLVWGLGRADRTIYRWAALEGSPYYLPDMMEALAPYGAGTTVMPFTTTMQATVPLVNHTGLVHASRFAAFWMLAAAYEGAVPAPSGFPYHAREGMEPMEAFAFDAVIEDLGRRPDLLIVDRMPPGRDMPGFDYLAYFGQSPAFVALLAEYRETGLVGGRYRLFTRAAVP